MTDRPGDLPPLAARLAEVEQDLLLRRGRCNAAIAAYNTYRAQIPQVVLSRLAGFRPVEFPAVSPAAPPPPSAAIVQLDVPGLRAVSRSRRPSLAAATGSESAERRPPRL